MSDVATGDGLPDRLHDILLRMAGRVDDDALTSARELVAIAESDRAVRLAQVFSSAAETLGDDAKAAAWLKTPNRALRGGRPLDQLDTDPGVREVESILGRIAYGVYS